MAENNKENKVQIQSVLLTFDDGSQAIFTGKAVCYPGDRKRIKNVLFTKPKDLPEGYSLEKK